MDGSFHRLLAEKFWINTTDFVGDITELSYLLCRSSRKKNARIKTVVSKLLLLYIINAAYC